MPFSRHETRIYVFVSGEDKKIFLIKKKIKKKFLKPNQIGFKVNVYGII